MAVMAKPRKTENAGGKKADRHRHPKITLRLPPPARDVLHAIAEAEDRKITAVVLRALREYAQRNGHPWAAKPTP